MKCAIRLDHFATDVEILFYIVITCYMLCKLSVKYATKIN